MEREKITADKLSSHGAIICKLFQINYPNGLTRRELEELSKEHGWLRRIFESLGKEV